MRAYMRACLCVCVRERECVCVSACMCTRAWSKQTATMRGKIIYRNKAGSVLLVATLVYDITGYVE